MSVDMYLSASRKQASSVSSLCTRQAESYRHVERAINSFIFFGLSLRGKAYDSAKAYYASVLHPLSQGGRLLSEMVEEAMANFPREYIEQVDTGDLSELQLRELIRVLDSLISEARELQRQAQLSTSTSGAANYTMVFSRFVETYGEIRQELEKKLKRLLTFHMASPLIFSDIESLQVSVNQGLALARTAWDPVSGTFIVPPDSEMGWVKAIHAMREKKNGRPDVYGEEDLYGGNQGEPFRLYDIYGDPNITNILKKHFPDMIEQERLNYLRKLNSEGCGYVALINTFLAHYTGSESDFETTFGFPLYRTVQGQKRLNFEYLIVDFYAGWDNHDSDFFGGDIVDEGEDIDATRGRGTSRDDREHRFARYMKEHGIKVDLTDKIEGTIENYNTHSQEGQIIVSVSGIKMVGPNGHTEAIETNEGHAMTVTGTAVIDGAEVLVVSSWGDRYYIDPEKAARCEFEVVKYGP